MKYVILFQGLYYLVTAVWPLVHIRSFELVTGEKKEDWLVYTVSLMILASSLIFLYASLMARTISIEVVFLSVLNTAFLGFISIYYPLRGIIRKIYLADCLLEVFILISVLALY